MPPLAHGLLRQAGIRRQDVCLGLGDGTPWVVDLLKELGCEDSLLDVYHAVGYLDKVLRELHYSEHERLAERKRWLKAKVDGAQWLQTTAREHEIDEYAKLLWSAEAQNAWDYLSTHAKRGALAYPRYKTAGWCIGSGQIEGYNKWAIGERMKGSGMHWSQQGLKHMAFLRGEFASCKPITSFHEIRLKAFSTPAAPALRPLAA